MSALTLPADMPAAIAAVAREAGQSTTETGGFILADAGSTHGTVLASAGERGIERHRDLFHVSGLAISTLFEWVEEAEMTVLAQWHSHRGEAYLSKTDLEHGFNVPGFHTTVVPFYANASADPADWGWWTCDGRAWIEIPAPGLAAAGFSVITFEEGRVDEH